MAKQVAASSALGVDGIVANYTGFDLNSLVEESEIAAETARQAAFFDVVSNWKASNMDKTIIFKGSPQNVIDKKLFADCTPGNLVGRKVGMIKVEVCHLFCSFQEAFVFRLTVTHGKSIDSPSLST